MLVYYNYEMNPIFYLKKDAFIQGLVHAAVAFIINQIDVFYNYEMNSILHLKTVK